MAIVEIIGGIFLVFGVFYLVTWFVLGYLPSKSKTLRKIIYNEDY